MSRWTKWVVVFGAVVVAIAIGVAAWTASSRHSNRTLVFADGARVTLLAAAVPAPTMAFPPAGRPMSLTHERYDGGWRDWLYPKLPPKVLAMFGVRPAQLIGFSTNSMAIWLKLQNAPTFSTPQSDFRIRASDDAGIESQDFWPYFAYTNKLAFFVIPNYPHRSGNVTVRVYHSDSRHPGELAKGLAFVLPNSTPARPPNWTAEPMPATRTTNGLEVTLTSLETGLAKLSLGSTTSFTTEGGRMYSRASFELRENGEMATNWKAIGLKLSAATGDSFTQDFKSLSGWYQSHYAVSFEGGLWSEEPAWEVTAEFQRTADFSADELWVLKDIKLPAPGEKVDGASLTQFNNADGKLISVFGGPDVDRHPPTGPTNGRDITIHVGRARSPAKEYTIHLVAVTDDRGGKPDLHASGSGVNNGVTYPDDIYTFDVSTNATSINITFAFPKSRFATFRVKPAIAQ